MLKAKRAVLLSPNRSGGTMMTHALNSHPLIHCCLDEPLHTKSPYRDIFNADGAQILEYETTTRHVAVSMCKVSYAQFFSSIDAPYIKEFLSREDVWVVHLTRQNIAAAVLSELLRQKPGRPTWAWYESPKIVSYRFDPNKFIKFCNSLKKSIKKTKKFLKEPVLHITYAEVVGGEGREVKMILSETTQKICKFFDITEYPLVVPFMKKVTVNPVSVVENWDEIKQRAENTPFYKNLIELEEIYGDS